MKVTPVVGCAATFGGTWTVCSRAKAACVRRTFTLAAADPTFSTSTRTSIGPPL